MSIAKEGGASLVPDREPLEGLDPEILKGLAEYCLGDPDIKESLLSLGFKRFEPAYTGYDMDTLPPGLDEEQEETWLQVQDQKKSEYFDELKLKPERLEKIDQETEDYQKAIDYMQMQVVNALDTIRYSKFGLRNIFNARLDGEKIKTEGMIKIMREKGIVVEEYPDSDEYFGNKDNNGQARYSKEGWKMRYNANALADPVEILHELAAVEVFDSVIRNGDRKLNAGNLIPVLLRSLLTKRTIKESAALTQIMEKADARLPIIDMLFKVMEHFSPESKISNFVRDYIMEDVNDLSIQQLEEPQVNEV